MIEFKHRFLNLNLDNITGVTGLSSDSSEDLNLDLLIEATGSNQIDTLNLQVNLADLNIIAGAASTIITHDHVDHVVLSLKNVERLALTDANLAFDVDGLAGDVYAMLAAALGSTDVTPELLGKYIAARQWYDTMGVVNPDQMLATSILTSSEYKTDALGTSNETFVKQIYKNVTGSLPSLSDLLYWTLALDNRTYTQEFLLERVSELETFRESIDLVGQPYLVYTDFAG